jgi:hypothetical protein
MNNAYIMTAVRIDTAIREVLGGSVVADWIVGSVRAEAIMDDAIGDRTVVDGVIE